QGYNGARRSRPELTEVATMTVDPELQALHQKAALGGVLTPAEQERLQQWYARMNEDEATMFATARKRQSVDDLQSTIDDTTAKIIAEGLRIQALEQENERLGRETEALKRQIAQKKVPQAT